MNDILKRLADKASDMSPLMKKIAGAMEYAVLENFKTSGARVGGWPALSPEYAKLLRKKGYDPSMMLDRSSAGLKHSITSSSGSDYAAVGTNKEYARIHNEGGVIQRMAYSGTVRLRTDAKGNILKKGNLARFAKKSHKRAVVRRFTCSGYTIEIPKREFLKLNDQDMDKIRRIVTNYFLKP